MTARLLSCAALILAMATADVTASRAARAIVDPPPTATGLALSFAGGQEAVVAKRGDTLHAFATVTVEGAGILEGEWTVAGPLSRGGRRDYQALSVFRQLVDPQDSPQKLMLRSPALPSALEGTYIARLSVQRGHGKLLSYDIKYFVGDTPSDVQVDPATPIPAALEAEGPSRGERAGPDSVFSWPVLPGSVAYQLELYDRTGDEEGIPIGEFNTCLIKTRSPLDRPPLAGLMVPGYRNEAKLGELAGTSLTEGGAYLWRVISLDINGRSLCESPFKEFVYALDH